MSRLTLLSRRASGAIESPHGGDRRMTVTNTVDTTGRNIERASAHMAKLLMRRHSIRDRRASVAKHCFDCCRSRNRGAETGGGL
jgi:hypothetical protein